MNYELRMENYELRTKNEALRMKIFLGQSVRLPKKILYFTKQVSFRWELFYLEQQE